MFTNQLKNACGWVYVLHRSLASIETVSVSNFKVSENVIESLVVEILSQVFWYVILVVILN